MGIEFHSHADDFSVTLSGFHDASTTSFALTSGDGAALDAAFVYPTIFVFDAEDIEITDVSGDTATVVRGRNGTSPATHNDGTVGDQMAAAYSVNELVTAFNELYSALDRLVGGASGIFRNAAKDMLKVVANSTPDLSFDVKIGKGLVDGRPVELTAIFEPADLIMPTVNPRIDLVMIGRYDDITTLTGAEDASPVAPTVIANNTELAFLFHRVGSTSIEDADDATNSFITDDRNIL